MKAAVIDRYGDPDVFRYGEVPDPVVGSGQVLMHVAATSVNPVDLLDRTGDNRSWRPLEFPAIIGWDVSGVVEQVGAGVREFKVGDQMMGWDFHTYAERVALDAGVLIKVPAGIDLADAAALPLAAVTGCQLVAVASGIRPGLTVLVSGARRCSRQRTWEHA